MTRHRDIPPVSIVDGAERHLVESVDVDHQVERLSDRQEVRKYEQLLRLLVALVAEAERHQFPVPEEGVLPQILFEPRRSYPAEERTDRSTEQADDELAVVRFRHRIVVPGCKAEVVGCDDRACFRALELRRQIERNARTMSRAEIRVQANRRQALAWRLLDERDRRPVRVEVEKPAVLVIEDDERQHLRGDTENRKVDEHQPQLVFHGKRSTGAPTSTRRIAMSLLRST